MMHFCKWALKKIKLFVLFWTRIVFVKNNFKVSFIRKLQMNFCGGYLADQYVLYDLKHNDKSEYLSEFDWYRSRYINQPFDFVLNNKVVCTEVLNRYIRMPVNYFIKNKGVLYDEYGEVSDNKAVIKVLKDKDRLVLKPFALGKGRGVHVLSANKEELFIDGNVVIEDDIFDLITARDGFIISEFMRQHVYAHELYPETVNTIRLITVRDRETSKWEIIFAVQRIGTSKTIPVDNGSKGGLVSKIDLELGTLSEARSLHSLDVFYTHPDSGAEIVNTRIPGWGNIKKEVIEVADRLPYLNYIAWDLLLTEDGVCVIEANTSSGVNIIQLWGGQRNGVLGEALRSYGVIS